MAPLTVVAAPEAAVTNMTASAPILEPAPVPVAAAPHVPVTKAPGGTHMVKPAPILMAAAPQATAAPQAAGGPMARYSAETMLVIANVAASDQNGNAIEGFKASDFVVTEDGAPQRIMVFEFQKVESTDQSLKSYYVLGYYTPNLELDGKFRRINVTLPGNTAAKVDFRTGYFARGRDAVVTSDTPGPGVTLPQLLHKVEPEYSEEARKAKFQGTVVLYIEVDTTGKATNIHVLRSLGLGLDEKAIEAVGKWTFIPGKKDLVAVPMQAQVAVSFRLL
jgi:TonB family protein